MNSFQFKTNKDSYPVKVHIAKPLIVDPAATTFSDNDLNTTIIYLNALGVPLIKYGKLIDGLTQKGFTVVSADYPCCGENTPHVKRGIDYGYNDLVTDFIPSLILIAGEYRPDNRIVLMGHSLGGHLGTIYSVLHNVPVIAVACGTTYYRNWHGLGRLKILQAVAVIKALTIVYGYLPGYKIGMGYKEPRTLMHDWCHLALTGNFDFITKDLGTGGGNALYINIHDDNYAPLSATKHLAQLCFYSKIQTVKLDDDLKGNPHGVWIKQPESVIESIGTHLDQLLDATLF